MEDSLSDILFSFVLEKYIVCGVCGLRSPSFESSSVLYISPTDTSSMQNFYKDCDRNCKNPVLDVIRTLGTSNQAIYYNLLNIYFSSFIDLDTLITMSPKIDAPYLSIRPLLGPLKFNLQATVDHHGPSMHSGHYTASINCCKNIYCNDHTTTEFGIIDSKNSSTAYVILYELIDIWFLDRRVGVWSLQWRWRHILSIPLTKGWGTAAENLWVGLYVASWWPLFPSRSSVLIYIYIWIYMYIYICSIWVPIVSCSLMIIVQYQDACDFGHLFKQRFDTRYLVFYNPSHPRMFLSLDLLSEYRIQHGAIGPLNVPSSY